MSVSDMGMVASSLRVVNLTARFHRGGASMSASRHPRRKPSAPNISHSIIEISAPQHHPFASPNSDCASGEPKRNLVPFLRRGNPRGPPRRFLNAKLERIPGRLAGIFQIAHIGAEPQTYARTDWRQLYVVVGKEGDAHATDKIGRSVYPCIGIKDLARALQIVDQDHGLGAIGPEIVAERWTLPIDFKTARVLGVERAFAIAQSGDEGAAGFLPEDVTIRPSRAVKRVLDNFGETH